jgi:hypothetical protein
MKKVILGVLLLPLLALEVYLFVGFLPLPWQHGLNAAIVHLLPDTRDWTPVTHPLLEQEIERVLSEHLWIRVCIKGITLLLLAVNAWAIYRLVRIVRSGDTQDKTLKGQSAA